MLVNVRLINNSFGLAFTHLFIMVPYTIWMSRGFIKTIPFTVEEAALIDGCNKIQAIVKVVLPMISSGLFAVGLYAFMLSWEEFLFAYTFTGSGSIQDHYRWPLYADRRGYQRLGRHYGPLPS